MQGDKFRFSNKRWIYSRWIYSRWILFFK